MRDILRSLRPHQWVKNLFVLAPLVFAQEAGDAQPLLRASAAFVLFCLISGAVYLLNDLTDAASDRLHPVKRHRPIAAGRLSERRARTVLAVLLLVALGGAVAVNVSLLAVVASYFCINIAYSLRFKHTPFLDVLFIAAGFILRLVGGAVAIDVPLSAWLTACTFLLAAFLALGKRKHELLALGADGSPQRRVLERYDLAHVRPAMTLLAAATLGCYAAYTLLGWTQAGFSPRDLVWTLPMVVFGLWRFHRLTERVDQGVSPTDLMLRDPLFILNLALWGLVILAIIYRGDPAP
ncbi:MAG: decaprenyl-phosphate phosphoribosyltransferase [Deltaproteobacteria bacterium]|nr:decaprenyl-phosphate phosphoribosyltransferase [Deltaproteobacteria bacterium]MCB9785194.1 decaprenyl-phosphate phosphoribosyltransferase [Deltaproteobacteria bacterium]